MPGGAIGPNVHMMVKAGIFDKYSEVLAEFPVVVEAGGAWTSVTPGSQQYWLQAFNNVMFGRWEKIDSGYGRSVLGYFGETPLPSNPEVVKIASDQLELPVFKGDPLEAAPENIEPARMALKQMNLPVNDRNTFLVLSAMVPGKKLELNEGIRLLQGTGKIDIPLKSEDEPESVPAPSSPPRQTRLSGPVTTRCQVEEDGSVRTFVVTVEPLEAASDDAAAMTQKAAPQIPVHSAFSGMVEVVDIVVEVGDLVSKGQVVAAVEAMKATHDIKAPCTGQISSIEAKIGDEIDSSRPIMTIS